MKKSNPNHALFRLMDPEQDSCCAALQAANELFLQRQSMRVTVSAHYVGDDSDLPEIFHQPVLEKPKP